MAYTTPIKSHRSVVEQKERLPLYLREFYETRTLDHIKIDGNEIQGYFEYSFINEKTYVTSPERSADGSIDNLNSYATFLTPRLVIKYNYMHISDYRTLMQLMNSKNEFIVECYDIVLDKRVKHKMYFAPTEMPNIHQRYLEVLGVKDYTIELIGTNSSFDTFNILYYGLNNEIVYSQIVEKGTDAIIQYDYIPPSGYRFDGQWSNESGTKYGNGSSIYISESMGDEIKLYADLVDTNQYTLSLTVNSNSIGKLSKNFTYSSTLL